MELSSLSKEEQKIIYQHRLEKLSLNVSNLGKELKVYQKSNTLFIEIQDGDKVLNFRLNDTNIKELTQLFNFRKSLKKNIEKIDKENENQNYIEENDIFLGLNEDEYN